MYKSICVSLIQFQSESLEIPHLFQGNRLVLVEDALENFITAYKEITLPAPVIAALAPVALCTHRMRLRDGKYFIRLVLKGEFQVSGIELL